jgi:hypothetical protein
MLSLVGRAADGWVPSLGYSQPADLLEGNRRIDEAAASVGRDPLSIRRILNAGADVPVEMFTSLTVEHGMDTYVIGGVEDPEALRWFASDVVPAVREAVAKAR